MLARIPRSALLHYGIAAALALLELLILAGALQPKVSDTYRARYIEGTSDCWQYNVSGQYTLGTRLDATRADGEIRSVLRCGWLRPEHFGTWAVGEEAKLRFRLPAERPDLLLDLTLAPFAADRGRHQTVGVFAGDRPLGRFVLDSDSIVARRIAVPWSAPLDPSGYLELTFVLPDAISGKQLGINHDTRRFAVRMLSLRLWAPEP